MGVTNQHCGAGLRSNLPANCVFSRFHDELSSSIPVTKPKAASQGSTKTMYDIVGSLPLELLIYVVEYLDLKDIVRSQRVCFNNSSELEAKQSV